MTAPPDREPQRWEKLGRVWVPNQVAAGERAWARTHAALPTTTMLDEERIRVYVACLDEAKVGRIGYVDVAARDPREVLAVSERPVLDVGAPGTFDDNGVNPLWLLSHEGRLYLYYVGWQLGTRVRYYLFAGLASSDDGGASFQRVSQAPLLDRGDGELFVRTAPCVRREGDLWKMWYIGGDSWVEGRGKRLPRYGLRYLESDDPCRWGRPGKLVMDVRGGDEHGFGRPFVVKEGDRYRMWYSVRTISAGYRLGYAESPDGLAWERMDDAVGIAPSPAGWDSEMVCYSFLQSTRYGTYLFYNGNDYGATGFGVAVRR
ncbi:MAG TPA: glucosyl hydrolase [Thermoanaerobaculia bacterium]|nr:glucosyl hydrolase [Thermoanaerobaculia bacterium]